MSGVLGNLSPWPRKPANNSVIAAEQAYRKRSGLPLLTDEDIAALKAGEPMPWERGDGVPSAAAAAGPRPAVPVARPATAAVPLATVASASTRTGTATSYVGTPAVGTSKAAAAGGLASAGPQNSEVDQRRRRLVWSCVIAFL